jgi:hypothetical protein
LGKKKGAINAPFQLPVLPAFSAGPLIQFVEHSTTKDRKKNHCHANQVEVYFLKYWSEQASCVHENHRKYCA